MLSTIKSLSIGAWITLSVIVASCAAIVIFAPSHFWESLGGADWPHIAGVITLVGTALVGVFVKARKDGAE